jgi:hypothetical protein
VRLPWSRWTANASTTHGSLTPVGLEIAFERRVRRLEGQTLARVFYQQGDTPGETPAAWGGRGPHPVGAAMHWQTAEGKRFRFAWADEFGLHHGFGVTVKEASDIGHHQGPCIELTHGPVWRAYCGRRIESANVIWRPISSALRPSFQVMVAVCGDHITRADFPQTLAIGFAGGGELFVSAAKLRPDGTALGFTNNLLVLFDREELWKLGLG